MIHKKLVLVLMLFMFASAAGLFAAPDVLVDLRLYEGVREKSKEQSSVVTSYYLKPISSAGKILTVDLSGEKAELEKIFNLREVKLMTQAKWGWVRNVTDKQFELVVLNGHKFIIQLTLMKKSDHFKLEVKEEGGEKAKTEVESILIIPQNKTTVFGFEDAAGKPYFLSCQRLPDTKGKTNEPLRVSSKKKPLLLDKVTPKYPKEALKAKVHGKVILETSINREGKVFDVGRISGHPLLTEAAVKAVEQWRYEPYVIDGEPKVVKFTVVVDFHLNKDKDKKKKEEKK